MKMPIKSDRLFLFCFLDDVKSGMEFNCDKKSEKSIKDHTNQDCPNPKAIVSMISPSFNQ